jgi:hypothetical protein
MPLMKLFLDICLFRKGPQDAPYSKFLFNLSLGAFLLVDVILGLMQTDWLLVIPQALLETAMLLGFAWITLKSANKLSRLPQTYIALFGTDALISAIAIPLVAAAMIDPKLGIAQLLLLMLLLWHTGVIAHILRCALSQTLGIALGLAIVYVLFSYQVIIALFGPGPG